MREGFVARLAIREDRTEEEVVIPLFRNREVHKVNPLKASGRHLRRNQRAIMSTKIGCDPKPRAQIELAGSVPSVKPGMQLKNKWAVPDCHRVANLIKG